MATGSDRTPSKGKQSQGVAPQSFEPPQKKVEIMVWFLVGKLGISKLSEI